MRSKPNKFLLSLISGLLLVASWYFHLSLLIFFAFVPLLILQDNIAKSMNPRKKGKIFWYSYISFVIWNIGVTWWMALVQFGQVGAILAWFANALLMSWVFLIFFNVKKRIDKPWAIWLFVPIWLGWEYLHSVWDLAWIWLDLGNVFAFNHKWIQWYEYTGVSGGTLWVLIVNILIFEIIKRKDSLKAFIKPAVVIILPIVISFLILATRTPLSKISEKKNVIVVQPNIDPYNEKFDTDFGLQFAKFTKLVKGKINSETDYLVLPETFIIRDIDEAELVESKPMQWFKDSILKQFPRIKIVLGASTYCFYNDAKKVTATARKDEGSGFYYDMFNTALQIDSSRIQVYHKSKLVPMVERMPFPGFFKLFEGLAIKMGGTSGSLGTQNERSNFYDSKNASGVAPVVCYESVFSDYTTDYVRKGADYIFILTNDGWWDDSPGYVQHLNYARLRAIENRRQIARSANTGISCFIDEFGDVYNATRWWEETTAEKEIYPNNKLTFFTRFGDIISYISVIITILTLVFALFLRFKNKAKN